MCHLLVISTEVGKLKRLCDLPPLLNKGILGRPEGRNTGYAEPAYEEVQPESFRISSL